MCFFVRKLKYSFQILSFISVFPPQINGFLIIVREHLNHLFSVWKPGCSTKTKAPKLLHSAYFLQFFFFNNRISATKHVKYPNYNFSREMLLMHVDVLSRFLSKQAKENIGTPSNTTTRPLEVRSTSFSQSGARAAVLHVDSSAVRKCRHHLLKSNWTRNDV
jgi:hypothetical protein